MKKIIKYFKEKIKTNHYQSDLEMYIVSKRPQNAGDIERYTREYHNKISQGVIL